MRGVIPSSRATLACLITLALLLAFPVGALAQGFSLGSPLVPEGLESAGEESADDQPRADWRSGTYGPVAQDELDEVAETLPPFGINLFQGGFRGAVGEGLTPGYRVKPGDQITVRAWGAIDMDRVLPVDTQGNIFLPGIGPLEVKGMTSEEVDSAVRSAIRSVYRDGVEVYTNLQGVQPVALFVTGYVENPGRYAGTPNDSLLYFIDQAGGIDAALGSYRSIRILRDGELHKRVDLYDFLLEGQIPRPQFQDGDTVVVEPRGPAMAVTGDVHRAYRYELTEERMTGEEVIRLARLQAGVSHVLLRGSRDDGPFARYMALDEFRDEHVREGDEVMFSADQRGETIVVEVEGSYYGPSRYVLPRDARLKELLDAIAVPPDMTAVENISLQRESVAAQQQASLEDSLRRLETTYLGATSATDEEAQIRLREAELIERFIERASEVEPDGRLVVAHDDQISDVRLQDGDVITIPESSDSLLISGEVVMPQAVVHKPGLSAKDYIDGAGGFTQRADEDHILLVRQNGAVVSAEGAELRPGDEILVMPQVPTKNLQLAVSLTQILYQVAVATRVIVDL